MENRTRRSTLGGGRKEKDKEIPLVPAAVQEMTDAELVKALAVLGIAAGPITHSSRTLYERIYVRTLNKAGEDDAKTETSSVNEDVGDKKQVVKRRSLRKAGSTGSGSKSVDENSDQGLISPRRAIVNAHAAAPAAPEPSHADLSSAASLVNDPPPPVPLEAAATQENGAADNAPGPVADAPAQTALGEAAPEPPAPIASAEGVVDAPAQLPASVAPVEDATPEPIADLPDLPPAANAAQENGDEGLEPLFSEDEEAQAEEQRKRRRNSKLRVGTQTDTFHWLPFVTFLMSIVLSYTIYHFGFESQ